MQGIVVEKQGKKVRVNTRTWVLDRQEKPVIEANMMSFKGEAKKDLLIANKAEILDLDLDRQYSKVRRFAAKKEVYLLESDSPSTMDTLALLHVMGRKAVLLKLLRLKKAKMYKYISNPFLLYLDGFVDFHTARAISLRTSLPLGLKERGQAYLYYVLDKAYKNGMESLTVQDAVFEVSSVLEINEDDARLIIAELARQGQKGKKRIILEAGYDCQPARLWQAKIYFLRQKAINLLRDNESLQPPDIEDINIRELLSYTYSILTGGPGTGKTTLLRRIAETSGMRCIMAGLTGKAAQRLGNGAMTIHSILGYGRKGFAINRLDCDLLIVDEASMLDWRTAQAVLSAAPRVIFSGDPGQLPPVEGENVFEKMMLVTPTVRLTKVWRFEKGHKVEMIKKESDKKTFSVLGNLVGKLKGRNFQVITPIHGGLLGTEYLNRFLQKICNPVTESAGEGRIKPEDKVIVNKNVYKTDRTLVAANGTIGYVIAIKTKDKIRYCKIRTGEKEVWVKLEHIDLAYALTVHKYQGSECDYVIFILPDRKNIRGDFISEEMVTVGKTRGRVRTYLLETAKEAA